MTRRRGMCVVAVALVAALTLMLVSCSHKQSPAGPQPGVFAGPDGKPAPFREPVRLSSKDGVLEVRLSAHQGTVALDTVSQPVSGFLVFGYELIRGTSSDGSANGDNLYPAPTLRVDPGRAADHPLRQRPVRAHHPGLLRSRVHAGRPAASAVSAAADLRLR